MTTNTASNIDTYINRFPEATQQLLEQIRATIRKAAPDAKETISYGMPTFTLEGNLVHFAAWKDHIGFYPAPSGVPEFEKDLSVYKGTKGSIQFPLDQPLPLRLIRRIVQFRVKGNLEKAAAKTKKKSGKGLEGQIKKIGRSTAPILEQEPKVDFLTLLSAPARRSLENNGIKTLRQLSAYSEVEVLQFHGMGPGSLLKLRSALEASGLSFRKA